MFTLYMYGKITIYQRRFGFRFLEYFDHSQKLDELPAGRKNFCLHPGSFCGTQTFFFLVCTYEIFAMNSFICSQT